MADERGALHPRRRQRRARPRGGIRLRPGARAAGDVAGFASESGIDGAALAYLPLLRRALAISIGLPGRWPLPFPIPIPESLITSSESRSPFGGITVSSGRSRTSATSRDGSTSPAA